MAEKTTLEILLGSKQGKLVNAERTSIPLSQRESDLNEK